MEYNIAMFVGMWGGLASALISNLMMLNILYIIYARKTIKGKRMFLIVNLIACTPPTIVDIVYGIGAYGNVNGQSLINAATSLYSILRLISLIVNLVTYAWVFVLVRQIIRGRPKRDLPPHECAIQILVDRLKYYPLGWCNIHLLCPVYIIFTPVYDIDT